MLEQQSGPHPDGAVEPSRTDTPDAAAKHCAAPSRQEITDRLRSMISAGEPIIGAGAGTGISAKFEERGGADLILVYNSGRYRMAGYGSLGGLLAIGDANAIVLEMGEREILPAVRSAPVIAGVNGIDPTRRMDNFLRQVGATGFAGVINFPSVGTMDGDFRASLEQTGYGFYREVDMIALARMQGLFTMAYVFNEREAEQMADAGADVVVAHMGLTTGGTVGATGHETKTLAWAAERTSRITAAARAKREDIIALCHGGPIESPSDAAFMMRNSPVHGFVGASSMERLPVEAAIQSTMSEFKSIGGVSA